MKMIKPLRRKILIATLSFFCIANCNSYASSSDAWEEHFQEVKQQCLSATDLLKAKPVGEIMSFDDSVGFDALLIRGLYPQPHMNQQPGMVLCLFDRGTRKAYITTADDLIKKMK